MRGRALIFGLGGGPPLGPPLGEQVGEQMAVSGEICLDSGQ
jgi:hypothetical protein